MTNRHLRGNLTADVPLNAHLPITSCLRKWHDHPFCGSVPKHRSQPWWFSFLTPPRSTPLELHPQTLPWSDHISHCGPCPLRMALNLWHPSNRPPCFYSCSLSPTPQFSLFCSQRNQKNIKNKWDLITPQLNVATPTPTIPTGFLLHLE